MESISSGQDNCIANSFEDLRNKIGLGDWIEDGLITRLKTQSRKVNDDAVSIFFSRLLSDNVEVTKLLKELSTVPMNEPVNEVLPMVNCRDLLFAIIHSCDPTLRQETLFTICLQHYAIPIVLPEPTNDKRVACLLADFENISKTWKTGDQEYERNVTTHPFPSVGVVRIGDLGNCSKSSVLNTLLGKVQGYPLRTYFYSRNEDNYYPEWSNGTIEAAWFLPNGNPSEEEYLLTKELCILNHRGPIGMEDFSLQEKFLYKFSTCILVFVSDHIENQAEDKITSICNETEANVIVVQTSGNTKTDLKCLQRKKLTIIDVKGRYSEMAIAEAICKSLTSVVAESEDCKTLDIHGREICEKLGIGLEYKGTTRQKTTL